MNFLVFHTATVELKHEYDFYMKIQHDFNHNRMDFRYYLLTSHNVIVLSPFLSKTNHISKGRKIWKTEKLSSIATKKMATTLDFTFSTYVKEL